MTEAIVPVNQFGNHMGISNNALYVRGEDFANVDADGNLSLAWLIANGMVDSFGRMRVSQPISRIDSQFTYTLQTLIYEQITSGSGATINHDVTERVAQLNFLNTPNGGTCYMQSYRHGYYHPGNSQQIFITFNFRKHTPGITKFAGYGDLTNNGIHFISNGTGFAWRILSNTSRGDQTVPQAEWNIDHLDGTGKSGINLEVGYTQIAVIDLQALYVGLVRVGFDIDGKVFWCHEFRHANRTGFPYIQNASLPLICGMTCTSTVSDNMIFICGTVRSEGAGLDEEGFTFNAVGAGTALSGARTHILSVRPKTTFNGIVNRINFLLESVDVVLTGNSPVFWELCLGQAISGTTTYNDINTTHSGFEYNTAGTISGSPVIVIGSGYVGATAQNKGTISKDVLNRYPITLDAAGAVRALGTLTLLGTGIGGNSACQMLMNTREIR